MKNLFQNLIFVVALILLGLNSFGQNSNLVFQEILIDGMNNNYNLHIKKLNLEKSEYTILKARGLLNPYLVSERKLPIFALHVQNLQFWKIAFDSNYY